MKEQNPTYHIKAIREQHQLLGLSKPKHPLVSVFRFNEALMPHNILSGYQYQTFGFYAITISKNILGKLKYGQGYCDFDAGVMSFISPNQVMSPIQKENLVEDGICLLFHPDFLAGYALAKTIKSYGYFSYEMNEALYLSDQEEEILQDLLTNIEREYQSNIDKFSQEIIIAQIELLLQYCNRFYNRQFITRKVVNDEILVRLENLLNDYFNDEKNLISGLPTVQFIARQIGVSVDYLSDMLRSTTGQNTQQHIHNKLIEKAKELLSTTNLSVKEIAYQLGFEYPQSFNKLFKKKTDISPLGFRNSFN